VVVFRPLTKEDIRQIVHIQIDRVRERLQEHNLELEITEAAVNRLAELGYNPELGARPLRRVIQQKIEEPISDRILAGDWWTRKAKKARKRLCCAARNRWKSRLIPSAKRRGRASPEPRRRPQAHEVRVFHCSNRRVKP